MLSTPPVENNRSGALVAARERPESKRHEEAIRRVHGVDRRQGERVREVVADRQGGIGPPDRISTEATTPDPVTGSELAEAARVVVAVVLDRAGVARGVIVDDGEPSVTGELPREEVLAKERRPRPGTAGESPVDHVIERDGEARRQIDLDGDVARRARYPGTFLLGDIVGEDDCYRVASDHGSTHAHAPAPRRHEAANDGGREGQSFE